MCVRLASEAVISREPAWWCCRELGRLLACEEATLQSSTQRTSGTTSLAASTAQRPGGPDSSGVSTPAGRQPGGSQLDEVLTRLLLRGLRQSQPAEAHQESIGQQTSDLAVQQVWGCVHALPCLALPCLAFDGAAPSRADAGMGCIWLLPGVR